MQFSTDSQLAHQLDSADELAPFRDEVVIADTDLIYLDGNSLGRLPQRSVAFTRNLVEKQWGESLIRGWPAAQNAFLSDYAPGFIIVFSSIIILTPILRSKKNRSLII